jgi:hypothetical protein
MNLEKLNDDLYNFAHRAVKLRRVSEARKWLWSKAEDKTKPESVRKVYENAVDTLDEMETANLGESEYSLYWGE